MTAAVGRAADAPALRWYSGSAVPLSVVPYIVVVTGIVVMAAFGSAVAPQNPDAQDLSMALAPVSSSHWLGTDELGRDVLSRIIVGARTAFIGPLVIAIGSMAVGNLLGLLAGYFGGRVDEVLMRWVDLMWSIPNVLAAVVVAGVFGGSYPLAVGLLLVLSIPFDTRVIRGATLEQTPRPYVEAAKTLGVSDLRIMLLHVWPNVSAVSVANAFLVFSASLVALSGLSYLGLGAPLGTPDWGLMLKQGQSLLLTSPVAALAPGAMIVITAVSMNLIGDWLYEWLSSRGATR